jgi:hypothetical protein
MLNTELTQTYYNALFSNDALYLRMLVNVTIIHDNH